MGFIYRENEHKAWLEEQRKLLRTEHEEKGILKAAKKRLKNVQRDLTKNNNWLRRQE